MMVDAIPPPVKTGGLLAALFERLRTPGEPVTRRAGRTKLLDRARVMVWGRR